MYLMSLLLIVSAISELLVVSLLRDRLRKLVAAITIVIIAFASGGIVASHTNVVTGMLLVLSAYRVVNMLRVVQGRMYEAYLLHATTTTTIWLLAAQAAVLIVWLVVRQWSVRYVIWLLALVGLQLLAAVILLASTKRSLKKTKLFIGDAKFSDKELPTVTIAVPARNEDEQLEVCLQSILASDYPKLEVLVLDDCSQDKTSQIIRKFAHDGVRFVKGDEPKPNWLAKNQAYERLAEEASGEILLFCGVDVRFASHTVRQLVLALVTKKKSMLSIIPINKHQGLSLPQTMRYMWELALPRRTFNRPPVLSTCWLIKRDELKHAGGFAAVAQAITPEAHFAKALIGRDGYSFMRCAERVGLVSAKTPREQRATAIRTRYPQLHRRPELVALFSLLELGLLVAPFVLVVVGAWGVFGFAAELLLVVTAGLMLIVYRDIGFAIFLKARWGFVPIFPVAVLSDVLLLNYSMWQYEFSEVIWKGRNVCIPVMRTYDSLPETK
jgi:Glycosyl transferase family 2